MTAEVLEQCNLRGGGGFMFWGRIGTDDVTLKCETGNGRSVTTWEYRFRGAEFHDYGGRSAFLFVPVKFDRISLKARIAFRPREGDVLRVLCML